LEVYTHSAREEYQPHIYSVSYSGKTIHTVESTALMDFGDAFYNIALWTESHRYTWAGGATSWVSMHVKDGLFGEGIAGMECNTVMWCMPTNLKGIAKCTGLIWDYGAGTAPALWIQNAEVDRSMPE
jgi:hypothetical protein